MIGAIGDVDVALRIDGDAVRRIELVRLRPRLFTADLGDELSVFVVFHHAVIDIAVGDEQISLQVPRNIGWTAEQVLVGRSRRRSWKFNGPGDRIRSVAKHHDDVAGGIELHDHVGALVDHPDVVLGIGVNRMRKFKPVAALSPLLDVVALLVEFEQARRGASRIHPHMPL